MNISQEENSVEEDTLALSNYQELKIQLRHILQLSKINHTTEILKETSLKHAHIYCKIHNLSGQVTGPLIENYIKTKYSMKKISASSCLGDLCHGSTNLEIKVSNGGKENNKFNYVQIRMNHDCEYLLTAYYLDNSNVEDLGELFVFRLNKAQLRPLILKYGGYAHGTVQKLGQIKIEDLENPLNDKEYAIRPKYGDKCWKELLAFKTNFDLQN